MDIVSGVRIRGIASAIPLLDSPVEHLANGNLFTPDEVTRMSKSLGVKSRRVVSPELCSSDLCLAAAERLLEDLHLKDPRWVRGEIDALLFVTQTPDYILPATACVLHARLGLSTRCAAFDINLGCSGYTYALYLAGKMLGGSVKRILILVGDTISKVAGPRDRSTAAVFGDAGSATALEADPTAPPMYFETGTDGTGKDALIIPAGGFRLKPGPETCVPVHLEDGGERSAEQLYMDGPSVFSFAISRVPEAIRAVYAATGWTAEDVDAFVFHQANRFMLEHLAKKMRIPLSKVPIEMENYGNTSSASIPLTLTAALSRQLTEGSCRLVLTGFGVGFSWAAVGLTLGPLVMSPLVEVGDVVTEAA